MGDSRRFRLFADLLAELHPDRRLRIADVAAGRGKLKGELYRRGYGRVTAWDRRYKLAKRRPGQVYQLFDFRQAPRDYRLVVGMHPDEATDHVILYAVKHLPVLRAPLRGRIRRGRQGRLRAVVAASRGAGASRPDEDRDARSAHGRAQPRAGREADLSSPTRVTLLFRWYDFWMGAYYDRERCDLYVLPLPMLGFKIHLSRCLFRQHLWSGWAENLGRSAVGARYRVCERCAACEVGA